MNPGEKKPDFRLWAELALSHPGVERDAGKIQLRKDGDWKATIKWQEGRTKGTRLRESKLGDWLTHEDVVLMKGGAWIWSIHGQSGGQGAIQKFEDLAGQTFEQTLSSL